MGIDGLLPALKPISKSISLEAYRNQVVAVDGYVWLHKAVLSAGYDIESGQPKDRYVWVCIKLLDMFASFGVKPYLVFDGRKLPSKLCTETERLKKRVELRELAKQHLKLGRRAEAEECFKKATDISPEIAFKLIEVLEKRQLPYLVSPYESDAQLAFLARNGYVAAVVTEDSDLIVFECPKVLYKLDYDGNCIEISYSDIVKAPYLNGITRHYPEKFRHHCILSGCDYLPSVKGVGLKTAVKIFQSAQTYLQAIRQLRNNPTYNVPPNYEKEFFRAELTFKYQWVYDPKSKLIVNLTPPDPNIPTSGMKFLGERLTDPGLVAGLVTGRLDPDTLKPINQSNKNNLPNQKPLSFFFKQPEANKLDDRTVNVPEFKNNYPVMNNNLAKEAIESIDLDSFLSHSEDELLISPTIQSFKAKKEIVVTPTQSRHFPSNHSNTNESVKESVKELSPSSRKNSESSYSSLTVFSSEDSLDITQLSIFKFSDSKEASKNLTQLSPLTSLSDTPLSQPLKLNSDESLLKSPSSPLNTVSSDEFNLAGSIQNYSVNLHENLVPSSESNVVEFFPNNSPVKSHKNPVSSDESNLAGSIQNNSLVNSYKDSVSSLHNNKIISPESINVPVQSKQSYSTVCHTFSSGKDTRAVLWEAVRQTSSTNSGLTPQTRASDFLNQFRCDSTKFPRKRAPADTLAGLLARKKDARCWRPGLWGTITHFRSDHLGMVHLGKNPR